MPRSNFYYPRSNPQPARKDHGEPIPVVDVTGQPMTVVNEFTDLAFRQHMSFREAAEKLGLEYAEY